MQTKPLITNHTPAEILEIITSWDETIHRGRNVSEALYFRFVKDFEEMVNVRHPLRQKLHHYFQIPSLKTLDKQTSSDGTVKFLFGLPDGHKIETVMIPDVGRKLGKRTLCVSSQVGCAMGCGFCLTGLHGLKRHLEPWEIVEQYREASRQLQEPITHIVFMGMGEPLHNFESVCKAIEILTSKHGAKLPGRKITVSTSGLVPQIQDLMRRFDVLLAVTLSAAHNKTRSKIMPVNQKWNLDLLISTLKKLPLKTRNRIFIEYVLLAGINDSMEDADQLAALLQDLPCKVNVIPFNEITSLTYRRPSENQIVRFQKRLRSHKLSSSIRTSRGRDISAACGQLSENHSALHNSL